MTDTKMMIRLSKLDLPCKACVLHQYVEWQSNCPYQGLLPGYQLPYRHLCQTSLEML